MLILGRRIGERIVIGENLATVTVLGIKGGQARLGIDAAREILVHREEIYLKNQRKKSNEPR